MSSSVHTGVALTKGKLTDGKPRGTVQVLRTVAALELAKGMIVLLSACGVLLLIHREDPWDIADGFLKLLHISPDHHFAQVFLNWADSLTETKVWAVAGVAVAYSVLRFAEAYGLWYARAWAEWIALVSGMLYLPFEIYKLIHHPSPFHIWVFLINVAIVLYMAYELKTGESIHRLRQPT